MSTQCSPIGVFDSGVGGLSILSSLREYMPNESMVYVADSDYAPYGDKAADDVLLRCKLVADALIERHAIKALVIACNTATSIAIDTLRDELAIPIIGVEPAIKPAALSSKNGCIGVLATKGTVESERFRELLRRHQGNFVVQACPGLVEQVEQADFTSCVTVELLEIHLRPLVEAKVDTVVLGCTHYPFLRPTIAHMMGKGVELIETGPAVARQCQNVLVQLGLVAASDQLAEFTFYVPEHIELEKFWQGVCEIQGALL